MRGREYSAERGREGGRMRGKRRSGSEKTAEGREGKGGENRCSDSIGV